MINMFSLIQCLLTRVSPISQGITFYCATYVGSVLIHNAIN